MASIHAASEGERNNEKKNRIIKNSLDNCIEWKKQTEEKKNRNRICRSVFFGEKPTFTASLTVYVTNHTIHSCSALKVDERVYMHYPVTVYSFLLSVCKRSFCFRHFVRQLAVFTKFSTLAQWGDHSKTVIGVNKTSFSHRQECRELGQRWPFSVSLLILVCYRTLLISLWAPSFSLSILAYSQNHSHMPIVIYSSTQQPNSHTKLTDLRRQQRRKKDEDTQLSCFRCYLKQVFDTHSVHKVQFLCSVACGW